MGAVLSIVGAVVQVLLIIILVLFLMTLFLLMCPISYKGKADYHGEFLAWGRVLWLCGLVYLSFSYSEGEMESHVRLFGLDVQKLFARFAGREKKEAAKGRTSRKKRDDLQAAWSDGGLSDEDLDDERMIGEIDGEDIAEELEDKQVSGEDEWWKKGSVDRLKQRLFGFIGAVRQFFLCVCSIWRKFRQKCEWAAEAKLFWQSENTQKMVCILKDNVLHLWRKLKPGVLRGNIVFGTGDPCTTGQILGAAAILYAYYGRGIQIVPDFEKARLEGDLFVKGRISLFTILIILLRIFLCGEWSQFRREAKQLKEAL